MLAPGEGNNDPYPADKGSGYGQGRTAPPLRGGVLVAEQCQGKHPVGEQLRQPTEDRLPVALLSDPPLTEERSALASLPNPALTEE